MTFTLVLVNENCILVFFYIYRDGICIQFNHDNPIGTVPTRVLKLNLHQMHLNGSFREGLLFDDCAENEGVEFEVSNPDFLLDENLNLVPRRDVIDSGDVMFIHGVNKHADDMAQVTIRGAPPRSPQTLREILGLSDLMPYRSKRSLLVPPMFVPENQRAPFPRSIGKVISPDMKADHIFRLTGKGADQDPKGVFSINRLTGEVAVSRALDREAIAYYHVSVLVEQTSESLSEEKPTGVQNVGLQLEEAVSLHPSRAGTGSGNESRQASRHHIRSNYTTANSNQSHMRSNHRRTASSVAQYGTYGERGEGNRARVFAGDIASPLCVLVTGSVGIEPHSGSWQQGRETLSTPTAGWHREILMKWGSSMTVLALMLTGGARLLTAGTEMCSGPP
ncbi:putative cadherin-13 [Triplophysa rosa]|uniref:Cadherin-13 n=1 Tax=Triplophysa rosa TaxID=992332 RepID=A0A9W7TTH1_TRIRA|nr:putative cadherin-13 [Triplophysa rosa]